MGLAICQSIIDAHKGRLWEKPMSPAARFFSSRYPARATSSRNIVTRPTLL